MGTGFSLLELALRRAGAIVFAGLLLALAATPAAADCYLSGSTITCMPPGTGGYIDAAGNNFTLNVQSGATVVDSGFAAIRLQNFNVITNNGAIAAGDTTAGIFVDDNNTIFNNASITAGVDGAGISGGNRNTVFNTGLIAVGDSLGVGSFGIALGQNGTVVNSGTITVGQAATAIAVAANTTLPAGNSVTNSGTINVGDFGFGIQVTNNHRVLNSGTITGGTFTSTIRATNNNVVTNTGTILAGPAGIGVEFFGNGNTLFNYGTIKGTGPAASINACNCTTGNTFNNMTGGTLDGFIAVDGAGTSVVNGGLITITDPTAPLQGYPTFLIANQGGGGAGNSFIQTASGTLSLRMDNTGLIDNLSADAITARGEVKIAIQNQLYANTTSSGTAISLTPYGVFTLGNTITTPFERYTASSPFFTVTPLYDSGDPLNYNSLSFQLDRLGFGSIPGMTPNQRAVGNVLEPGYSAGLTGDLAIFYANLLSATSLTVLDQLSGAGTAAAQDGAFTAGSQFNNAMFQQVQSWLNGTSGSSTFTFGAPLGYASAPAKNKLASKPGSDAFAAMQPRDNAGRWRAWTSGFGGARAVDGETGTANQTTTTFGGAFGVDRQITPDFLLGVAVGGSGSNFSASGLSTSGRSNAGHIGAYAIQRMGTAYLAATMNYARGETSTDRTITGIGPTENAKGRFTSDQFSGRFEIGRKYGLNGYALTPFVALEPAALWQHAYTETSTTLGGAPGVLGLTYQSNTVTSLPLFLGAQLDATYALPGGHTLSPYARISWVHEFKPERRIQASFVSIPGGAFTVDGARASADALRMETGGTLAFNRSTAVFLNVTSEFSSRSYSIAALGGVKRGW